MLNHSIPGWIEAGGMVLTVLIAAISVSSITLYRLDRLEDKVDQLTAVLVTIHTMKEDVKRLKENSKDALRVFGKFSDSVDRLAISIAKLEIKVEGLEEDDGKTW